MVGIKGQGRGRKQSEEHNRKIREKLKGHIVSLETRRKISLTLKGKHCSPRTEFKKGNRYSDRTGTKHTPESKRKMSESHKGCNSWMKGKRHTKESKQKMSNSLMGRTSWNKGRPYYQIRGKNHFNWQGGKSFEPYGKEFNKKLKEKIRAKHNRRCQQCFREQSELRTKANKPYKLIVHHIDYNKKNNSENNLIPLCRGCHAQTNFKRGDWTNYFKERCSP